jgi:hypothetical protein
MLCEIYSSKLSRYRYSNDDYFRIKVDGVWSKRRADVARKNAHMSSDAVNFATYDAWLMERMVLKLDSKPLAKYAKRLVDIRALAELFEMCEFHLEEYRRSQHMRASVSEQEMNEFDAQWGIGTSRFTLDGAMNNYISTGIIIRNEGFLAHKIGRAYQLYSNNVELMMQEPEHFAGTSL